MNNIKELEQLENLEITNEALEPQTLQAPKRKRTPTPKQLENLKRMREIQQQKTKENQIKKKLEEEAIEKEIKRRLDEERKILENKILKKAISIKKKEIKKQAVLEEISDDETPMEKIKEIANKKQIQGQKLPATESINTKPKYIFV